MNSENSAQSKPVPLDCALAPMPEEPTKAQLSDACTWYNHSFGLANRRAQEYSMFEMRERWRAIWKAINTPGMGTENLQ